MERIEFDNIIEDSATEILYEKENPTKWRYQEETLNESTVRDKLIVEVWIEVFREFKGSFTKGTMMAEKIVSAIIKKGIPKDQISYSVNSFEVNLPNQTYLIYKMEGGYAARPRNTARCSLPTLAILPDKFVQMLFQFDSAIPQICTRAEKLHLELDQLEMKIKRDKMVKDIKREMVQSLVQQFLVPLGISAWFSISDDGQTVSLNLRKVLSAQVEIPFDKIAEKLKDPSEIVSSMEVEEPLSYSEEMESSQSSLICSRLGSSSLRI